MNQIELEEFQTAAEKVETIGQLHEEYSFSSVHYGVVNLNPGTECSYHAHVYLKKLPTVSVQGQSWEEVYHKLAVEIAVSQLLHVA